MYKIKYIGNGDAWENDSDALSGAIIKDMGTLQFRPSFLNWGGMCTVELTDAIRDKYPEMKNEHARTFTFAKVYLEEVKEKASDTVTIYGVGRAFMNKPITRWHFDREFAEAEMDMLEMLQPNTRWVIYEAEFINDLEG